MQVPTAITIGATDVRHPLSKREYSSHVTYGPWTETSTRDKRPPFFDWRSLEPRI